MFGLFEGAIKLDQETTDIRKIFGVGEIKTGMIVTHLLSSAMMKPRYAVMMQRLLDEPQFTSKEKLLGIFVVGKLEGVISTLKQTGINIKFEELKGPRVAQNAPFFQMLKIFLTKRDSTLTFGN